MRKQALEKALKTFLTFEDLGPRQEELEYFFQRYPQVPREVILKEDLLRLGFTFSEAALQASAGCRLKSYRMFSYDRVKLTQMGNQEGLKVPEDITIQGGIYGLRPLIVRVQVSPNSPYQIDVREDRLVLLADGLTVAEVAYPPAPAYYSRCFEDGTPYYQVVPMVGGGRIPIVTASRYCQHWGVGEQCQFCDISETARELAKLGKAALARTYKKVEQVVQVMETIFQEEKDLPTNPRCFTITGGTITGDLQGLDDTHFYLQYVEAVRERIGREWRGALSTEAKPRRDLETFRAAGVDVHMANIEVWEPHLFKALCPGKERRVGRDEWLRRLLEAVEVFGRGNVNTHMVAGIELAQPYGFSEVGRAVESTSQGLDFLMEHGVLPTMQSWICEPGSSLAGHPLITLDYFIQIDRNWYQIWKEHGLPAGFMGPVGPGQATWALSAFRDMGSQATGELD